MNKALFLDRDGVINSDVGYTHIWSPSIVMENIVDVVRSFKKKNYLIVVITNQSGIGRAYYSEEEFKKFMKHLFEFFDKKNACLDDYYYCSCDPMQSVCMNRKPNPGMFFSASEKHNINLSRSVMIGDKVSDMIAADRASIKSKFLYAPLNKRNDFSDNEVDFTLVHSLSEVSASKIKES